MHTYVSTKGIFKACFKYTFKVKKKKIARWKLHIATFFLQASFRVFTTPDHSDCSSKDNVNQTHFLPLMLLLEGCSPQLNGCPFFPRKGTHCYVLYIRHSCNPVFSTQTTPSFYSISGSSYSIHNWYTSRVLNHKTSISPLLISTTEQHSRCWDTPQLFSCLTTTHYMKEVSKLL